MLGINSLSSLADMYQALTTVEKAYSDDLAVVGQALATAGGFPTLDAAALNTIGRHAAGYFTQAITNLS